MCYEVDDVETIWSVIKLTITTGMDKFIPKVQLRNHQYPKWWTASLRHSYKCMRSIQRKYDSSPSAANFNKKIEAEAKFRTQSEQAKATYERELIDGIALGKSSCIYDYIRSIKDESKIPSTLYLDSISASSDIEKAELFNTFFHSVFTSASTEPLQLDAPQNILKLGTVDTSPTAVYKELLNLNVCKAKGLDGIGPSIMKHCALALYEPLSHLFTQSITSQQIPMECATPLPNNSCCFTATSLMITFHPLDHLNGTSSWTSVKHLTVCLIRSYCSSSTG